MISHHVTKLHLALELKPIEHLWDVVELEILCGGQSFMGPNAGIHSKQALMLLGPEKANNRAPPKNPHNQNTPRKLRAAWMTWVTQTNILMITRGAVTGGEHS